MTEERGTWAWYASDDDETWTIGPAATREDAIEEARDEWPDRTFWIIEGRTVPIELWRYFDGDYVLDNLVERIEDDGVVDPDRDLHDEIGLERCRQFGEILTLAVRAWQEGHGLTIVPNAFAEMRNKERID